MAEYKRRKYNRKPLVTNTMILSLLSNADYHTNTQIRIKNLSSKTFFKVKCKTNEDLNISFFRLKNLSGLATI